MALTEAYVTYRSWISKNPQLTSDIESAVKWISYFVSGRISESSVVSELVYSVSNLLVLFNDKIIIQSQALNSASEGDTLKTWLTVLEYSEVFIEVTALRLWGQKGKWIIVVIIQLLKCAARLTLLFHHKQQIIQNPPLLPLERKQLLKEKDLMNSEISSPGFRLKSGRVIRTINATTPVHSRTWQPPELPSDVSSKYNEEPSLDKYQLIGEAMYIAKPLIHLGTSYCFSPVHWTPWLVSLGIDAARIMEDKFILFAATPVHSRTWQPPELPSDVSSKYNEEPSLDKYQLIGEAMYIAKPLIHLGTSYCFSPVHWTPWLVSLGIDAASLPLLRHKKLSRRQDIEVGRRRLALLLYLLRSPFYEKHTRDRLSKTLITLADNVPLVGMLLRPLAQYIPRWQETYFYMWST